MERIGRLMAAALLVGLLPACQSLDEMTRPRAVYQAFTPGNTYEEKITDDLSLEVRCIEPEEKETTSANGKLNKERGPCAYKAVNEAHRWNEGGPLPSLASYFATCRPDSTGTPSESTCQAARNRVVDLMKRISDENCATFLQQTFLTKSTADSAHRFARDMITGGTAAAVTISPPTAIGMSFANLLTGSYESVNGTFFLNEAFQSIETAINLEREERLQGLETECPSTASYDGCTIHEAMRQVRRYEDGCSLRAGLNKLQTLVHLQQSNELVETAKRDTKNAKAAAAKLQDEVKLLAETRADLERRNAALDMRPLLTELSARIAELKEDVEKLQPTPPTVGPASAPIKKPEL